MITSATFAHNTDHLSNIGAFWLTFGATLVPSFNAYGAYVTDPEVAAMMMGNPGNPAGLQVPAFNASFAFFLVFMGKYKFLTIMFPRHLLTLAGMICLIFMICSLRTNIAFFVIFVTLVCAFGCLAGAFFNFALAYEDSTNLAAATRAHRCIVVRPVPSIPNASDLC